MDPFQVDPSIEAVLPRYVEILFVIYPCVSQFCPHVRGFCRARSLQFLTLTWILLPKYCLPTAYFSSYSALAENEAKSPLALRMRKITDEGPLLMGVAVFFFFFRDLPSSQQVFYAFLC